MTIVLTISKEEWIVVASDRKITTKDNDNIVDVDSRDKIIPFVEDHLLTAYWGLARIEEVTVNTHLTTVKESFNSGEIIDVDTFSEKCKDYFEALDIRIPMGIICGFKDNRPKVRHVFHEHYHDPHDFINEETNILMHDTEGNPIYHTDGHDYIDKIYLYNGENEVIRLLLNELKKIYPNSNKLNFDYDFSRFTIDDIINLAKIFVTTTIYLQNFLTAYRKHGRTCGNGIDIYVLKPDGSQ